MNILRRFFSSTTMNDAPDLSGLMPVLVPLSFPLPEGALPPSPMGDTGFGATAVYGAPSRYLYLTQSQAAEMWDRGIRWQDAAMQNLVRRDKGFPFTQERRRDDGRLILLTLGHEDGLGTSRVLMGQVLSPRFPDGYRVALPDRGIGFALSNDVTEAEEQEIRRQIRLCFERAILPGSPRLFAPESFLL